MAKDEETGIDPKAENGELTDIEAKRRARDAKSKAENGGSVAERAARGEFEDGVEPEVGEEDDGQTTFVVDERGKRVTLGNLVKRGKPVEYRIVMGSQSQKGVGGLLDPDETNILLLVRGVVGDVKTAFVRGDDESIERYIVYLTIKPKMFIDAKSEQARVLLHGEPPTSAAS